MLPPQGLSPTVSTQGFFLGTAPRLQGPCRSWDLGHTLGSPAGWGGGEGAREKGGAGTGTHGHRLPWAGCGQQGDAEDRNRAGSQGARPRDEFLESSNGVKAKKKAGQDSPQQHQVAPGAPRPCSSAKGLSSSTQRSSSGYYREIPPPGDFWSSTQGAEPFPKKQAECPGSFLLGHHAAP